MTPFDNFKIKHDPADYEDEEELKLKEPMNKTYILVILAAIVAGIILWKATVKPEEFQPQVIPPQPEVQQKPIIPPIPQKDCVNPKNCKG